MLQKMGWSKGKGLGKEEQGDQKHVAVSRRSDKVGIGAKSDLTGNSSFTSGIMNFQSVLQNLAKVHGPVTVEETIEESSSSDSDSDASTASGKKRRRVEKKQGNQDKSHKGHHHHHHRRRVTHKVTKYLDAKDVSSYKAGDLAAILGRPAPFPVLAAVGPSTSSSSSAAAGASDGPAVGRAFGGRATASDTTSDTRGSGDAALGSKRDRDLMDTDFHPGLGAEAADDAPQVATDERARKRSKKDKSKKLKSSKKKKEKEDKKGKKGKKGK